MRRLTLWVLLLTFALAACALPGAPAPPIPVPSPTESGVAEGRAFDVEGHRGARGLKPENTLPAFETALDLGVTTLELDLHYTADGVVVIWHDDSISADKCRLDPAAVEPLPPDPDTTPESQRLISRLPFAQLQKYRCDRNPDPARFPEQDNSPTSLAGDRYQIASLAQLFDFVDAYAADEGKSAAQRENARQVQFNIETKRKPGNPLAINDSFDGVNPGPFEEAIVSLVEERGLEERVIVQSFDHRSLWAVRRLNPAIRLAALTRGFADPEDYAAQGATIWSPRARDLTPALLEKAHAADLQVIPWTVNNPDDMRQLIAMGVDGLITDRPDVLLAVLEEESP